MPPSPALRVAPAAQPYVHTSSMRLVSKYYSTVQYFVCEFRQNARTIFDADDSVHGRARGRAAAAFHICDMILKEAGSWVQHTNTSSMSGGSTTSTRVYR